MTRRTARNEFGLTVSEMKRYNLLTESILHTWELLNPELNTTSHLSEHLDIDNVRRLIRELGAFQNEMSELIETIDPLDINSFDYDNVEEIQGLLTTSSSTRYHSESLGTYLSYIKQHSQIIKRKKEFEAQNNGIDRKSEIIKDIVGLEKEFVSMRFNNRSKTIYVETEDIVLKDEHQVLHNLGPMEIAYKASSTQLHLRVKAVRPVTHQHSNHYHPHIDHNGSICMGESSTRLYNAHKEADVYSIFMTIKSLLETYNISSPYSPLENWDGTPCDHCGRNGDEARRLKCSICNDSVCHDCYIRLGSGSRSRNTSSEQIMCLTCQGEREKNTCHNVLNYGVCGNFINPETDLFCRHCLANTTQSQRANEQLRRDTLNNIEPVVPDAEEENSSDEISREMAEFNPVSDQPYESENSLIFDLLREAEMQLHYNRDPNEWGDGTLRETRDMTGDPSDPDAAILPNAGSAVVNPRIPIPAPPAPTVVPQPIGHCISCRSSIPEGHEHSECNDCGEILCLSCAGASSCEDCGGHVCGTCRIPCSRCRIPVHLDCTLEDNDRNLLCRDCHSNTQMSVPAPQAPGLQNENGIYIDPETRTQFELDPEGRIRIASANTNILNNPEHNWREISQGLGITIPSERFEQSIPMTFFDPGVPSEEITEEPDRQSNFSELNERVEEIAREREEINEVVETIVASEDERAMLTLERALNAQIQVEPETEEETTNDGDEYDPPF